VSKLNEKIKGIFNATLIFRLVLSLVLIILILIADVSRVEGTDVPKYERKNFGSSWADVDRDCQNTRQEELINQSTSPVYYADDKECRVVRGRWISIFTDDILTDASTVDIDHIFSLKDSWLNGSHEWTPEKRKEFANDPINLAAVEASLNRAKGAKNPTQWLPPKNKCAFVLRYLRIGLTYKVDFPPEYKAELDQLRTELCDK